MSSFRDELLELLQDAETHAKETMVEAHPYHEYDSAVAMKVEIKWAPFRRFLEGYARPAETDESGKPARIPIPRLYSAQFKEYLLLVTLVRRSEGICVAAYVEHTAVGKGNWTAATSFRFEVLGQAVPAVFTGRYQFGTNSQSDRGCPHIIKADDLLLLHPSEPDVSIPAKDAASLRGGEYFNIVVTVRNGSRAHRVSRGAKLKEEKNDNEAKKETKEESRANEKFCAETGLVPIETSDAEPTTRPNAPFTGLTNQGATCYLNSLLQTLFHLKEFRRACYRLIDKQTDPSVAGVSVQPSSSSLASASSASSSTSVSTTSSSPLHTPLKFFNDIFGEINQCDKTDVALQLALLFVSLQQTDSTTPVKTTALTDAFGWEKTTVFEQHDVQELARILLENLERKMKGTADSDLIQRLLMGKMRKVVTFLGQEKSTIEPYYDLQIRVKGFTSLKESIRAELQTEYLNGENKYHVVDEDTGIDKGLVDAEIAAEFVSFPSVLMVHLRRFEYCVNKNEFVKVNDRFQFHEELDLNDTICTISKDANPDEDNSYLLHSVLVHSGGTGGGHYYAFIAAGDGRSWYKFNDSHVYPSHATEVVEDNWGGAASKERFWLDFSHVQSNAYMLVYVKRHLWAQICGGSCEPPATLRRHLSSAKLCFLSIFLEKHIAAHVNAGGVDLLPPVSQGIALTVSSTCTWGELISRIADATGVPKSGLKLWITTQWYRERQRGLGRPSLCVSDFGMYVGQDLVTVVPSAHIPHLPVSSPANPVPFYVDHHVRKTPQTRITFLKKFRYSEGNGRLTYLGAVGCPNKGPVKAFVKDIGVQFGLNFKHPKVWVERGPERVAPCCPPDVALVADQRLECDSRDGSVLILADDEPQALSSKKIKQQLGSLQSTPDEKSLLLADQVLGAIGLDRYNIVDNIDCLEQRENSSGNLNRAAHTLLHPSVQFNCRQNVSVERTYELLVTAYPLLLCEAGEDGRIKKNSRKMRIKAQTNWSRLDTARAVAPRLATSVHQLRFWSLKNGRKHTLWNANMSGDSHTLGDLLNIPTGAWYAHSARGEALPEKELLWEVIADKGGSRPNGHIAEALLTHFDAHNRAAEHIVVPVPASQTVSDLLESYRQLKGLDEGLELWLLVVNGARLERVFSQTAASAVTDDMLRAELRVVSDDGAAALAAAAVQNASSLASVGSSVSLPAPNGVEKPEKPAPPATLKVGVMHASHLGVESVRTNGTLLSPSEREAQKGVSMLGTPHLLSVSEADTPESIVERASQLYGFPAQQHCAACRVCAVQGSGGTSSIGNLDILKSDVPVYERLLRGCMGGGGGGGGGSGAGGAGGGGSTRRVLSASLTSPGSVFSPAAGASASPPILPRIVIVHNYQQTNTSSVKIHN